MSLRDRHNSLSVGASTSQAMDAPYTRVQRLTFVEFARRGVSHGHVLRLTPSIRIPVCMLRVVVDAIPNFRLFLQAVTDTSHPVLLHVGE